MYICLRGHRTKGRCKSTRGMTKTKAGKLASFPGLVSVCFPATQHHARVQAEPLDSTRGTHQPECATKEYQESLVNVCGILICNCGINSRYRQESTTKVSNKYPIGASPRVTKTKAGKRASLPGLVPWHSKLAYTIPAPRQNHQRKQATGIIHQPKQVDEGGIEPGRPHTNFKGGPPLKVNNHY